MTASRGRLTHSDGKGRAGMVDVSAKLETARSASASGRVICDEITYALLRDGDVGKGDVFQVARIAGIAAAKQTATLIPLCHPLALTHVDVNLSLDADLPGVTIAATARCFGRTGVEMEALTAVSVAALTVIDMAKASDRWMSVEAVGLVSKEGGKSGPVTRPGNRPL